GKLTAMAQSLGGMFAGDEVMKGSLASYTFEHMEIASYKILIAAAEAIGEQRIARVCQQNLEEEEAMALSLSEHLAPTTDKFLSRAAADADTAKRCEQNKRSQATEKDSEDQLDKRRKGILEDDLAANDADNVISLTVNSKLPGTMYFAIRRSGVWSSPERLEGAHSGRESRCQCRVFQ